MSNVLMFSLGNKLNEKSQNTSCVFNNQVYSNKYFLEVYFQEINFDKIINRKNILYINFFVMVSPLIIYILYHMILKL